MCFIRICCAIRLLHHNSLMMLMQIGQAPQPQHAKGLSAMQPMLTARKGSCSPARFDGASSSLTMLPIAVFRPVLQMICCTKRALSWPVYIGRYIHAGITQNTTRKDQTEPSTCLCRQTGLDANAARDGRQH